MNFKQRLLRYMIGVFLGILISLVFFKDKLSLFTSWLPGNAVKTRIIDSYWDMSAQTDCLLLCAAMDVTQLKTQLSEADVDFSQSQTKGVSKEYLLIFPEDQSISSARFGVKDSSATLIDLQVRSGCDCP